MRVLTFFFKQGSSCNDVHCIYMQMVPCSKGCTICMCICVHVFTHALLLQLQSNFIPGREIQGRVSRKMWNLEPLAFIPGRVHVVAFCSNVNQVTNKENNKMTLHKGHKTSDMPITPRIVSSVTQNQKIEKDKIISNSLLNCRVVWALTDQTSSINLRMTFEINIE